MGKIDEKFISEHDLNEIERLYQESAFAENQVITLQRNFLFCQILIIIAFLLFYSMLLLFLPISWDMTVISKNFFECFWIVLLIEIFISVVETFLLVKSKRRYLDLTRKIDEALQPFGLNFNDWIEYKESTACRRVRWRRHYRHLGGD